jgi:hypothetical protein
METPMHVIGKTATILTQPVQAEERDLIDAGTCARLNTDRFKKYVVNFFHIDDPLIRSVTHSAGTFSGKVHEDLKCVVEASLYVPPGVDWVTMKELARATFSEVRRIGKESSYGLVFATHFLGEDQVLVFKVSKETDASLFHEIFVAFYCTNALRQVIPNFMYIYGYFRCAGPVDSVWCSGGGSVIYAVLEYLPGRTVRDYIISDDCTVSGFMLMYVQVITALAVAYAKCGFTHYDLHANNVLLRRFSGPVTVPVYNGATAISTQEVAVIIDFGAANIRHNGKNYGTRNEAIGIEDNPYPLMDALKFLVFCAYDIYTYGTSREKVPLLRLLSEFYRHLVETTPGLPSRLEDAAKIFVADYGNFAVMRKLKTTFDPKNYVDYVLRVYRIPFVQTAPLSLVSNFLGPTVHNVDVAHVCRAVSLPGITNEVRAKYAALLDPTTVKSRYEELTAALKRAANDIDDYRISCEYVRRYVKPNTPLYTALSDVINV